MRIKAEVEIVTGFLGSGKTTFISALIENTLVDEEKVLVIQCEKGEQEINNFRNNSQIIIKNFNPQDLLTVEYLKDAINCYNVHRVIIEHNGSRRLEELLLLFDEKELLKICKLYTIYNITDVITYELYVSNMGNIILDSLCNSNLIVLNNKDKVSKEKLETITKQLEKFNSDAFILQLNKITEVNTALKEHRILFNGYRKKLNIFIKNFLK